ncbi:hypothetical protein LAZ67_3004441 [Cordylochernes scorpioides]|uniref:Uncharacterized protein n=1 Tax=Cordylochernes scorpioides TaxID=51811 RepID=A0ABY6K9H2_9ARAC|nr:hypothetical protein LAZ67_3004441 [Cordylochernes scorpioides]
MCCPADPEKLKKELERGALLFSPTPDNRLGQLIPMVKFLKTKNMRKCPRDRFLQEFLKTPCATTPNMEYKRCSSCIPGSGALTEYYQPGQLSPGQYASFRILSILQQANSTGLGSSTPRGHADLPIPGEMGTHHQPTIQDRLGLAPALRLLGHEADAAFKLALHALPHPAHPASAVPSCPACGSVDRSLGHRYWSCSSIRPLIREAFNIIGRPPDLQAWIFGGSGFEDDALTILASAKLRVYRHFVQVGLGGVEDPLIAWTRTLGLLKDR